MQNYKFSAKLIFFHNCAEYFIANTAIEFVLLIFDKYMKIFRFN